ncbi:hypothetical protein [Clostridium luticellarii]|uniref:Uncharacterized protein n=1 Tax=Clostridium luticellarii TaxID=1691940 RepID=A0A2T0BI17_9CLOT|nr:hypothetical protein [Clostridium luticellarii]PRR83487.1 hypothetical protein CLLU_26180 [Clostridium luticellarii]
MSTFGSITPKELSLLANLVAFQLTEGKSADDNLLIAAQQENLESLKEKQDQIKDLKKQIKDLK